MCGIYGIISPSGPIADGTARVMRDALAHRGPDHRGHYEEPGVLLGNNRLSILDLDTGDQPIFNEDRSLVIVYNGELYNHPALRTELEGKGHVFSTHSDTETILHAFEEHGPDCLGMLQGMFTLAIFNIRQKRLFLARDRLGIKPLYTARTEHGLAFASEAKALLPLMRSVEPDWTALNRFFSFGYVPSPDTPFMGIDKFPPGCFTWTDGEKLATERYWRPAYGTLNRIGVDEARAEVAARMEQAVRAEMLSDVPVGIFLSGGLDSSAVAAFAQKSAFGNLHSFGVKFPETSHDESADSRLMAKHLGLRHHEFTFGPDEMRATLPLAANSLDEPFGDATVLPLLYLSLCTAKEFKVVLTGWGGDEIFAGYPTYLAHRLASWYRHLPGGVHRGIAALTNRLPVSDRYMSFEFKAKRFIKGMDTSPEMQHLLWMGYFDDARTQGLFTPQIEHAIAAQPYDVLEDLRDELPGGDPINRILFLDSRYFLEGNGLFQADRMTMAASLEARVPLLNPVLLDYVNALPARIKMPGGRPKGLMRSALIGHLPQRIVDKPKKGFGPPCSQWLRGPMAGLCTNLLARDRLTGQGIFNPKTVMRLVGEHMGRKADHGRCLWALISFQLWHGRFIENRPWDDGLFR